MALADGVVVEIVCRGHLHHARAERAVDVVVGDDWNLASGQRQQHGFADQTGVARIVRVHHHRDVAEQGFRAGGGDDQMVAGFAGEFIAVLVALDVLVGRTRG